LRFRHHGSIILRWAAVIVGRAKGKVDVDMLSSGQGGFIALSDAANPGMELPTHQVGSLPYFYSGSAGRDLAPDTLHLTWRASLPDPPVLHITPTSPKVKNSTYGHIRFPYFYNEHKIGQVLLMLVYSAAVYS
jgi:hypothetical protein